MSNLKQPRILVVEDEYLIRLMLVEALSDEGYDVIEAETGDAALPILQSDPAIGLLLTDIQLPGTLNGQQLAERVRQHRPELPILFMTGRPDPTAEARPNERYIAKPYTLNDICSAVNGLLGVPG